MGNPLDYWREMCVLFQTVRSMTILELNKSTGESRSTVLGQDVLAREKLQHVVPAGT